MTLNYTRFIQRGIRHVETLTLYPQDLGIAFWYKPRAVLYENSKIQLHTSEEFELQMLRTSLIPANTRWSLPLNFVAYDVSSRVLQQALEWEKLQALPKESKFLAPWMPLAIYEAQRKGVIETLLEEEGAINTFYIQEGLAVHTLEIRMDPRDENEICWYIHSQGMGNDQPYPDRQRIFVAL